MKRPLFAIFLLIVTAPTGWAQKAFIYNSLQKNGFVAISVGTSLPTGNFGQLTNCADLGGSGMAVSGRTLNVSGGYRLAGPLGLMARYEQVHNDIRPDALTSVYAQQPTDVLKATTPAGREGQWQSRSVMFGPYATIPLGRFALDFRALAGQAWATCPETCVSGTINKQETLIRSDNQESKAIAAGIGMSVRYRITPAIGFQINTDYSSASFRFNDIPLESKMGDVMKRTTYDATRTLSMVNISAGITIQFRSKNRVF